MKQQGNLQPFLRCSDRQFAIHLCTALIPIMSDVPEPFDAGEYGILSTYVIDGSKLSADQALALASWIARDSQGFLGKFLHDIQTGKCRLPDDGQYEVVWLDEDAQFWG